MWWCMYVGECGVIGWTRGASFVMRVGAHAHSMKLSERDVPFEYVVHGEDDADTRQQFHMEHCTRTRNYLDNLMAFCCKSLQIIKLSLTRSLTL